MSLEEYLIKELIKAIEVARIRRLKTRLREISEETKLNIEIVNDFIKKLLAKGLIVKTNDEFRLSGKGRKLIKIGLMGGVFDIIHLGHITTLSEAKNKCDLLVVVVARDSTVRRMKGRDPINDELKRLKVIESLKQVDVAILGDKFDFSKPLKIVSPDVVFLGYDQTLPPKLDLKGVRLERLNVYVKGESTSNLVHRFQRVSERKTISET